ncbi:MAG: cytochrome c oxidase subunit 3 [Pseudomonadota bacterium]|nr:cytochrome c oxidase subunit 3 [Pseudomonadota bacterium]
MWLFMCIEVITFGMFLLGHAWGWRGQAAVYREAQALLHVDSGVRGTVLLLVGSGLAYQAVLTNAAGRPRATAGWFAASAVAGLAFSVNKVLEYGSPELAGITLSTNDFWFSYIFITGLHLLHVLGGVGVLAYLSVQAARGVYGPDNALNVEAGAAYWHLVDVAWILVFPILYLMHP